MQLSSLLCGLLYRVLFIDDTWGKYQLRKDNSERDVKTVGYSYLYPNSSYISVQWYT